MFRDFLIAAAVVATILATWIPSVDAADQGKIGFVDVQKIVFQSKVGQAGIASIKKFQEDRQKEISEKEKQLLKDKQEYETKIIALSEAAKKLAADEIAEKEISLKRLLEDSDRELRKLRNELLQKINKDVIQLIKDLGKEKGYSFIAEKESFLYADPAHDITELVIKRYDKLNP